jgi:hypothetical protein
MNPLSLLNTAIDSLWYWTYGILVGWGASFTILAGLLILLSIKMMRMNQRITMLNNRIISLDREVSLTLNEMKK